MWVPFGGGFIARTTQLNGAHFTGRWSGRTRRALSVLALPVALGVALTTPAAGAEASPAIDDLLARVGDRIAESWSSWDTLGMLQQLGAVPAAA